MGAAGPFGLQYVFFNIIHGPNPILRAVLIDHAQGASVVGASDGGLDDQRISFAGRAIYGSFIAHRQAVIFLEQAP
jgi:hypothetical protein